MWEGLSKSHFGRLFFAGTDSRGAFVMDFFMMLSICDVSEGPFWGACWVNCCMNMESEQNVEQIVENWFARHASKTTLEPVGPLKISQIFQKTRMASNTPSVPEGTVADIYIYIWGGPFNSVKK